MPKTKILMVCLGNICRSPLAEGILQSKVDATAVFVDSAGTGGYHIGKLPDPRSISVAAKNGLDISHQRCRKFEVEDKEVPDPYYGGVNGFDQVYNLLDNACNFIVEKLQS